MRLFDETGKEIFFISIEDSYGESSLIYYTYNKIDEDLLNKLYDEHASHQKMRFQIEKDCKAEAEKLTYSEKYDECIAEYTATDSDLKTTILKIQNTAEIQRRIDYKYKELIAKKQLPYVYLSDFLIQKLDLKEFEVKINV